MFNLIIYDLDGTILDTIYDIHNSLVETLTYFKFPTFNIDTTKSFVGDGFKILLERSVGKENFKQEHESFFREVYTKNQTKNTNPFDKIDYILELQKKAGKKLVILSNKAYKNTDYLVKYFSLDNYFDAWYGGDSFPEKKPSPTPVYEILKLFGIKKENSLLIGDNYTDIEAGHFAGISTCFCKYGYGKLSHVVPDFTVKSIKELKNF